MNQRERVLTYAIGGLLLIVGAQSGVNKYRSSYESRRNKVANLRSTLDDQEFEEQAGILAMEQLAEYRKRSLPSDPEAAQAQYKAWLESLVGESGLEDWSVDYVGDQGSNSLFRVYTFRIIGAGDIKKVSGVVKDFHARNYLHRTKKLTLRRNGNNDDLLMNLDVEAMAMRDAAEDQPAPDFTDPRIGESGDKYVQSIINRNMFSPPNQAPRYTGSETLQAYLDRDFATRLKFEDPDEGDHVDYEVVGELPSGFQLNKGEIIGRPKEKGEFTFIVKAWDSGLPSRVIEKQIALNIGDPPPAPEEPKGPPKFDESRQAILTGLVQSRGQWSAWINVRTKNQLLKLRAGDDFEVGSVAGKIVEVTDRYAVFESEGESYTLQQDNSLADAKAASLN